MSNINIREKIREIRVIFNTEIDFENQSFAIFKKVLNSFCRFYDDMKKLWFPNDAYVGSCPICRKNLERYLIYKRCSCVQTWTLLQFIIFLSLLLKLKWDWKKKSIDPKSYLLPITSPCSSPPTLFSNSFAFFKFLQCTHQNSTNVML